MEPVDDHLKVRLFVKMICYLQPEDRLEDLNNVRVLKLNKEEALKIEKI